MAVPLEPECLSERAGCLRALAGREGAQASQPAGGLVGTPISQTSLGVLAMERAALVVGASGRTIDLDLEGDAFHEQFADALVRPASGNIDNSALAAAWRGSWPRPFGPPPSDLRLAVGVLVVHAISTVCAANNCAESDEPQGGSISLAFHEVTQEFLDDAAVGAAQLCSWQRRAFRLAAESGMAESARKRRRTAREGAIAAAHDFPNTFSLPATAASDTAAAASAADAAPAGSCSSDSSGSNDSSSDDDANNNGDDANAAPPNAAPPVEQFPDMDAHADACFAADAAARGMFADMDAHADACFAADAAARNTTRKP